MVHSLHTPEAGSAYDRDAPPHACADRPLVLGRGEEEEEDELFCSSSSSVWFELCWMARAKFSWKVGALLISIVDDRGEKEVYVTVTIPVYP